jgi:hypothetical protein
MRDLARAPGSPPTGQTCSTPRDSILPSTNLLVRLDQRFAIDPHPPSLRHFAMQRVTWLEPRTPHQPGKLQKLSKNEFVFTPFIFRVNKKSHLVSTGKSIDCRPSTAPCRESCAIRKPGRYRFSTRHRSCEPPGERSGIWQYCNHNFEFVKIKAGILMEAEFAVLPYPSRVFFEIFRTLLFITMR